MHTGRYPFREPSDERLVPQMKLKAMFPRIVRGEFPRLPWMSDSCNSLLDGMLNVKPDKRFTVADVLAHPWFKAGRPL